MIPEMVHTLETAVKFAAQMVGDLSEREMVEQPKGTPNHATWTLGHITHSCDAMAAELGAETSLPKDWESLFGYGSTPLPHLQRYPQKQELLSLLSDASSRLSKTLLSLDESVLERSLPGNSLPTMRHLLMQVVVAHTAYHTGQLAVWRRALGKKPVGVFV
jgi:uncharacterized damage-inducible protein DinB